VLTRIASAAALLVPAGPLAARGGDAAGRPCGRGLRTGLAAEAGERGHDRPWPSTVDVYGHVNTNLERT